MDDKKSIARNILKNLDKSTPEQIVSDVYSLTGDNRLVSDKVSFGERVSIARAILSELVKEPPTIKKTERKAAQNIAIEIDSPQEIESISVNRNINELSDAGIVSFSSTQLKELEPYLPEGFDSKQLTTAIHFYSKGVRSKDIENAVDEYTKYEDLSSRQAQSMYATAYLISAFEEHDPHRSTMLQSQESSIRIKQVSRDINSTANTIVFSPEQFNMVPMIQEVAGKGIDVAREKVTKFAFNAIKKGGESLSKKAAKKGAGVAVKAGVKTGVKIAAKGSITALAQALGTTVPVIGNIIAFIATDVLPFVFKKIKQLFGKLKEVLLGPDNKEKRGFLASLIGVFAFMAGGFTTLAAISGVVALGYGTAVITGASLPTAFAAFVFAITSVTLPAIGIPVILAIIGTPIVVAIVLFIINSGAYIVPRNPLDLYGTVESPYIGVEKVADPEEGDPTLTVNYTVTVTAKRGTLTNISFENECMIIRESSTEDCTHPVPDVPELISPVEDFVFEYSRPYGSSYNDSLVIDTFTVTADVEGEVYGEQAAGSAGVCIGDCPENCPRIWPTNAGYFTQGAYSSSCCSHSRMEAVDIGTNLATVFATHTGVARVAYSSCIGNYIDIESVCAGRAFISRYAHLEGTSVGTGELVTMGQSIGLSGNTGSCTSGAHLHYRFRYTSGSNPSYPSNPPYMMPPYTPSSVARGCCNDVCSSLYCSGGP